jgi:hypothetical protein
VLALAVVLGAYQSQESKSQNKASLREPDREAVMRETLAELLAGSGVHVGTSLPIDGGHSYRELHVRWQSLEGSATDNLQKEAFAGTITRLSSATEQGALPRLRTLDLSPDQILAIAVDDKQNLLWWTLMNDSRLVRAEMPTSSGEMKRTDFYQAKVEFFVSYPDDSAIREIQLYHPQWTGKNFQIELLGRLPVE